MGLNLNVILFVCAFGFTCAAIISMSVMNVERLTQFRLPNNSLWGWIVALPLMAFTGPYWIAVESCHSLTSRQSPWVLGIMGLLLAIFWSFCAGVFVVEFLHLLKIV